VSASEQAKLTAIQQMAREAAERSRREQGLPPRVTDPDIIQRVAEIVRADDLATSDAKLARTA
jgi:hypothetical protein